MSSLVTISKFLSLVLRHTPEKIKLVMDKEGWVDVDDLIKKVNLYQYSNSKFQKLTKELLKEIVETNNKKRFAYNDDGTKIRASQGHSIDVDLNLQPSNPPEQLYHGTSSTNVSIIMKIGLKKMERQHVHLSSDYDTAVKVGSRHGKPIVLTVWAEDMHNDGYKFFLSENNVWLTDMVPIKYLELTWSGN